MNQLFEILSGSYIVGSPEDLVDWVEGYPFWYYDANGNMTWTDNYN